MGDGLRRREFLQTLAVAAASGAAGAGEAAARRPNIVFILTDDQRFDALGSMGHPFVKTPAKRHAGLYADAEIESRHNPKDRLDDKVPWGRKMPANWRDAVRSYCRAVTSVDENLGRVLKTLEELGVLDDTAIVFAGDNGYFQGEHGGLWDKRAAYEPSMRIPLLMRYPPLARPGSRPDALVLNIDLAPTLLDLAGLTPPESMQGRSWLPALAGRDAGRESFLYEYFREGDRRFNRPSTFGVRTRRWKYIEYPEHPKVVELYDLRADPHELGNQAAAPAHAATLGRLRAELARLKQQTGFRLPSRTGRASPRKKKER